MKHFPGGRINEPPAVGLTGSLINLGFEVKRLKTGTPPRIDKNSIDFSLTEPQPGDNPPNPFSHFTDMNRFRKEKKTTELLADLYQPPDA